MRGARTSNATIMAVAIGAAVVVAAVAAGGLRASRTVETDDGAFDAARITEVPLVVAKRESGGVELLGVQFDAPDRWLSVAVMPPTECLRVEGGEEVVVGGDGCERVEPVSGPVKGGGITAEGERWVELWVEVGKDCHRAAEVGDTWAALPESCR